MSVDASISLELKEKINVREIVKIICSEGIKEGRVIYRDDSDPIKSTINLTLNEAIKRNFQQFTVHTNKDVYIKFNIKDNSLLIYIEDYIFQRRPKWVHRVIKKICRRFTPSKIKTEGDLRSYEVPWLIIIPKDKFNKDLKEKMMEENIDFQDLKDGNFLVFITKDPLFVYSNKELERIKKFEETGELEI